MLIFVEKSLSLLTEICSIELPIELSFLLCSDSIDSFRDRTFKWDFYGTWTRMFKLLGKIERVNETLYNLQLR